MPCQESSPATRVPNTEHRIQSAKVHVKTTLNKSKDRQEAGRQEAGRQEVGRQKRRIRSAEFYNPKSTPNFQKIEFIVFTKVLLLDS